MLSNIFSPDWSKSIIGDNLKSLSKVVPEQFGLHVQQSKSTIIVPFAMQTYL